MIETQQSDTLKRDNLAVQRTQLANERTILAYIRTSLSFVGFGVLILKLFPEWEYFLIAGVSILTGLIIMVVGLRSYRKHKKSFSDIESSN